MIEWILLGIVIGIYLTFQVKLLMRDKNEIEQNMRKFDERESMNKTQNISHYYTHKKESE